MKAIRTSFRLPPMLLVLLIMPVLVASCSDDDPASPTGSATVTGTLTLPDPAPGREYVVLIDTDYEGDVHVAFFRGECSDGTELSYSFSNVAPGTYFVYALVRLVSDPDADPETGDLYGIYGGSLSNMPPTPNVTVPSSGTITVDLTMGPYFD